MQLGRIQGPHDQHRPPNNRTDLRMLTNMDDPGMRRASGREAQAVIILR